MRTALLSLLTILTLNISTACSSTEKQIVEDAYLKEASIFIKNCGRAAGIAVASAVK